MKPDFYEDEVIEGFYVPSMLKKAWGVQMDVLRETDIICRRHNIPYFADWGTLLATIRHSGYIPWDDDLDISMKRKDYERFLRYAEKELPEGFKVMHFKNHPGHLFFVARIVGKPRICFEEDHLTRFHGFPYIAGIDLFVLDNVCSDREKEYLRSKKAEFVLTVADNIAENRTVGKEAEEQLRDCEKYTGRRIDRSLKGEDLRVRMYELVEELFASVPDEESDALVQMMPFGMYGNTLHIPKEYYRDTVRLPYMDTAMPVPICFDAVMRRKYGNYMEIHKAWGGHDYPFFYGQHEQLLATLDFEYPAYKATPSDITCMTDRLPGISERSEEYLAIIKNKSCAIKEGDKEATIDLQKVMIEFGTSIESVYGEGYGPVPLLESSCEILYDIYCGSKDPDVYEKTVEPLSSVVKDSILDRHDIVFMPFAAKHWKYMEPLYHRYKSDDRFCVHVIPVPYYYKAYDGVFTDEVFDPAQYPSSVNIEDYKEVDLEGMHPDKIVIQNPFDEWNTVMSVLPEHYSVVLKKYTDELIYVPFFVTDDFTDKSERDYINMDHYVCMPGVINADSIILQSDIIRDTYIEKILEFIGSDSEDIRRSLERKITADPELIIHDTDECTDGKDSDGRKTILFYTSISSLAEGGSRAVCKIRSALDVFAASSDRIRVVWITRCCSELPGSIDKITADGFKDEVKRFLDMNIGEYVQDPDPCENDAFAGSCDAYYGEPSSVALSVFYRHKPIMIMNLDV
ncbi:MAG: LicD family protein [Lachnospiraceae bacterium]|nr:LicD family protein [Lachnospiraceae bacterium]